MAKAATKTQKTPSMSLPKGKPQTSPIVPLITVKRAAILGRNPKLKDPAFRVRDFLVDAGLGKTIIERPRNSTIFSQGDTADAAFYIQKGKVKISVVSAQGKEATVAVLGVGAFVGEDCIATTHPSRLIT